MENTTKNMYLKVAFRICMEAFIYTQLHSIPSSPSVYMHILLSNEESKIVSK